MTYALDTNIISYFLRNEGNVRAFYKKEIIEAGNLYAVPPMVVYEIKRWLCDKPTSRLHEFSMHFDILLQPVRDKTDMSLAVWERAANIYIDLKQRGQLIGDADILIAGYCLINNYILVTNNTDDFKRIDGIKLVNWY